MKAEMVEATDERFKPIKIELTLESEEEVQVLWHRTHISSEAVKRESGKHAIVPGDGIDYPLWETLTKIAELCSILLFESQSK